MGDPNRGNRFMQFAQTTQLLGSLLKLLHHGKVEVQGSRMLLIFR